jgi:hypothetical protein
MATEVWVPFNGVVVQFNKRMLGKTYILLKSYDSNEFIAANEKDVRFGNKEVILVKRGAKLEFLGEEEI